MEEGGARREEPERGRPPTTFFVEEGISFRRLSTYFYTATKVGDELARLIDTRKGEVRNGTVPIDAPWVLETSRTL